MMESKSRLVFSVLVLLVFATFTAAVRLTDVSVSNEVVDYQGKFEVEADFSGDTCSVEAWYFIGDYRFARKNVGCDPYNGKLEVTFEDEDDWDNVKCGPQTATVEIYNSMGLLLDNRSVNFSVGVLPVLKFMPSRPLAEKEVRVTLLDPDTGNPLKSQDVEIKDKYGGEPISRRTASDGSFVFTPDIAGEYTLTVKEREVCGDVTFYAKRPLLADGPHPENPVVDEMVLIAVPSGSSVGVKVLDSEGNLYLTVPVSYNGGGNFSISEAGEYTLVIGDLSTKYWSLNKTLTVTDRPVPELSIKPDEPVVGKPMTFTVTSRNEPLAGAVVTVTKPDGVAREYTTSSYGTVNYDAVTSTGEYKVAATKDRYSDVTSSFEAYHAFEPYLEPALPTVRDTIVLTVNDQNGNPVSDALVEIPDTEFMRVCDVGGRVSFNLEEAKEYTIDISKDLFWDKEITVTPYGILSVKASSASLMLGGNVTLFAYDSYENPTSADLKVTDPDGVVRYYTGSQQLITPDKPGEYVVSGEKTNHLGANVTFTVEPYALDVSTYMSQGTYYVNVTREGEPISGLKVNVKMEEVDLDGRTDDAGMASFKISQEGNLTLTVNVNGDNIVYEERIVRQNVVRSYDLVYLTVPLVIVFLITLFAIIAIQLGRAYFGKELKMPSKTAKTPKKKGKKPKAKHDSVLLGDKPEKKRSRLSGI
ncbi:MAG: hypothetical protein GF416_08350 [Candidatus Altiarchaeales archaeon]|nr:hypothetical protein [Candidatus Altiarchaeales archaeon]MBD3417125.1 hypothetical protein [Candidatus Altiarchaeales archaeon]